MSHVASIACPECMASTLRLCAFSVKRTAFSRYKRLDTQDERDQRCSKQINPYFMHIYLMESVFVIFGLSPFSSMLYMSYYTNSRHISAGARDTPDPFTAGPYQIPVKTISFALSLSGYATFSQTITSAVPWHITGHLDPSPFRILYRKVVSLINCFRMTD